jgi:hypothetical protein
MPFQTHHCILISYGAQGAANRGEGRAEELQAVQVWRIAESRRALQHVHHLQQVLPRDAWLVHKPRRQ